MVHADRQLHPRLRGVDDDLGVGEGEAAERLGDGEFAALMEVGELLLGEGVDHDIAVVEQHPVAVVEALDAQRPGHTGLGDLMLDLVDDRLDLAIVAGRGDDELVGYDQHLRDLEDHDVASALGVGRPGGGDGQPSGVGTFVPGVNQCSPTSGSGPGHRCPG